MTSMIRLQPSWIVPINPRQCVYTDYDLVIEHGRIQALLPRADADRQYPRAQLLLLPGQVVLPGLVNGHGHAAMTLLRGYADDFRLMEWLENHIWPVEAKFVSEPFVATGAWLNQSVQAPRAALTVTSFPSPLLKRWYALGSAAKSQRQFSNFPMPGPGAKTIILRKASNSSNGPRRCRV